MSLCNIQIYLKDKFQFCALALILFILQFKYILVSTHNYWHSCEILDTCIFYICPIPPHSFYFFSTRYMAKIRYSTLSSLRLYLLIQILFDGNKSYTDFSMLQIEFLRWWQVSSFQIYQSEER